MVVLWFLVKLAEAVRFKQTVITKEIGVPQRRIGEIVAGKRAIIVDTGLRLSAFFGMSEAFWSGLQTDYDIARTRELLAETLARIPRYVSEARSEAS